MPEMETTHELIEEMKNLHRHLESFSVLSAEYGQCQVLGYLIHVAIRLESLENNARELLP
jgi:hypothetical protein